MWTITLSCLVACAVASCPEPLCHPGAPSMNLKAPESFTAIFHTSKGSFNVQVTRNWSPYGADRFFNLCSQGFFNDTRFYRVIPTWVVQFGVSGSSQISSVYRSSNGTAPGASIPNDPVIKS